MVNQNFSLIILNMLMSNEKKESPAKNLTFLLLIVPYQIAVRMEEGGEKKKGFFSNVSCEETFLNNSNPTAHVHCKILSIRINQTHHQLLLSTNFEFFKYIPLSKYLEL